MNKIRLSILSTALAALFAILGCKSDNTVSSPEIQILSVTPNQISRGATLVPVDVKGRALDSVTSADLGAGISIVSKRATDAEHLELTVSVSGHADPGPRTLVLSGSGGSAQLANAITIRKNPAPDVRFTIAPDPGSINLASTFDASGSTDNGSIASYQWDFGDGSKRNGVKVSHQFEQPGTYAVRLTVTDNKGGVSIVEKELEVLDNLPPVASFTVDPTAGSQLTAFTFDATSSVDPDGTIQKYSWDFGDGATSHKAVVKHRFDAGGDYDVKLTITDNSGADGEKEETFAVRQFDVQAAMEDIDYSTKHFLQLFDDIENLTAEEIVVDFSTSPACPGRQHEIDIINNEKQDIESAGVEILGDAAISGLTETTANADLTARFFGTRTDGSSYDGIVTHHFQMINEGGDWKICNFTTTSGS